MNVKCLEEIQSVKLVGEPSPLDGLVVLESDRYICIDGFTVEAANLVCRELGFPAVKDYTAQIIPNTATSDWTQWLSYSTGCQRARVKDCLLNKTECEWNKAVRLRCQEPGFLGCYRDNRHSFQALYVSGFHVQSDEECVSTCRRKSENHDIAIVNERTCTCYQSEAFTNFISGVSSAPYWTPETIGELKPGPQIHCLFNLSVGFCEHPGPVSDGCWDSNIMSFGSKMTLTCGEGFIISGSATLQCVRLPGWSTYFPIWNASVPYCRAVDNATNDNACHDANISTTSSLITDGTSNEIQTTEQWTALQETVDTAFPVSGDLETKYTALTIGSPVSLAALALAISFIAWCKHRWKKKRRHLENSNKLSTQPLHSINTNALHRALSEHLGNKTNQEDVHHICQNRTEDHTLEGQVVSDLLNTISRPLSDVIPHRDSEDVAQYQDITSNVKKELYMDMTGNVKKKEDVKFVQYRSFATTENDIDENGYMLSNVGQRRPMSCEQEKTIYMNNAISFGSEINRDVSIQFRPADSAVRCEVSERSVYEDILSTSNQSAPLREPQHGHEYATIERNEKRVPFAIDLNSLYSVTIYSSKQREERELDENGYLVLEACAGEIAGDQYVEMDKEVLTTASLYEDILFPQNKSP